MTATDSTSYRSFGEQALHYFRREHESVARDPIVGRAAWRGAEMTRRSDWIVTLGEPEIEEIDRARAAALATGRPLARLKPARRARPPACEAAARSPVVAQERPPGRPSTPRAIPAR